MALLLLLTLVPELLPCTAPCSIDCAAAGAPPCLTRLRVCGNGDLAPRSLADQALLLSQADVPLPPAGAWNDPPRIGAALPDGYVPPVYRPPRLLS